MDWLKSVRASTVAGHGPCDEEDDVVPRESKVMATVLLAALTSPAAAQDPPPDTVSTIFVTDTVAEFGAVGGVVVDGLGYVYLADFRNAVWRLSPNGDLTKFADGLYGASGNAIGPRGYLYQSSFNGNYISRISRTGDVETYVTEGLSGPVGIAAGPSGELFVVNCNAGSVSRVDSDRRVTEFAKSDLMACPNGITFDDRGDLYVVSFNNTKVVRITPDGEATEFADVVGMGGNGHITFARGAFYVTKFRGNQIFRVQRDGSFEVVAGTGQAGTTDGDALEATFTRPNGIGVSPGGKELWVNDLTVGPGGGLGRNTVALRRIRLVSLSDVLAAIDPVAEPDVLRSRYEAYRSSRSGENSSADALALGFQWLTAGRIAHAAQIFQLNAESYPDDVASQFGFGEFLRYTGQPDRAAEQYRRALELQPDHPTAGARLAEVTGGD